MRVYLFILTFLLAGLSQANPYQLPSDLKCKGSSALNDQDMTSVKQLMEMRRQAFEEKSADKLLSLFADNSNFVNQAGRLYWGKEANLERHKRVFSKQYGEHTLTKYTLHSTLKKWCAYGDPAHTVILVTRYYYDHHDPALTMSDYDARSPTEGIFTTILSKTGNTQSIGGWQIISMQNSPTLPSQHNE